jgi:thiamine monophosphate synthase
MIIIKDNYYLYIENLEDINLGTLAANKKINIIYRNPKNFNLGAIINFRKKCKIKKIKFFIANDYNIAKKTKADGLYISAYNKKKYYTNLLKIGSAHNLKEINEKKKQNCNTIIISRLFRTNYSNKKTYLGILKFNLLSSKTNINIIALGGINYRNLLKLNMVKCKGFAFLSALKKKPAILHRLF